MIFQKKRAVGQQVLLLPVEQIQSNPAQPRTVFDEAELDKLAESIRQNGLLQPISVRQLEDGKYELISGERRLKATKKLGYTTIKAITYEIGDQQSAIFALIENLQREDLSFFDEARGIYELIYQWEVTQEEAAQKLGMAQSTLANKLRLLRLSPVTQKLVTDHGLTERHARALLRLQNAQQQEQVIREIVKRRLNVTQTERYIENLLQEKTALSHRLLVVKDLRIFLNTINKAVSTMKEAGIEAKIDQTDEEDYIEYTVRIPKQSAYQQKKPLKMDVCKHDTTLLKVSI